MRDDTVRYLKACLGVSSALAIKSGEDEIGRVTSNQRPSWPLLSFFKPIEEQVQKRYTNGKRNSEVCRDDYELLLMGFCGIQSKGNYSSESLSST